MRARFPHLLVVVGLLGLLGCVSAPAGPSRSMVSDAVRNSDGAGIPRSWVAPAGWHLLYSRPGFTGAAAVDLRAVGDIMLARGVEPLIRRQPPGWLFGAAAGLLRGDIVTGNLESPFATARRPDRLRPGPYRLPADPALVDRLAPFTALSLANNHALDAGVEGLADAERVLRAAGIAPLRIRGGSCLADPAATPAAGEQAHLLAYNAVPDPQDRPDEAQGCGRAWLDDRALEEVAALRASSRKPIIVLVHWGGEYEPEPDARQRAWARRLVAAGADLIVGSHPHVVQPSEMLDVERRRGFVAYSLGNFVFDQSDRKVTSRSLVLRAWLQEGGVAAVAVAPVAITAGRPEPLDLQSADARMQIAAIGPRIASVPPHASSRQSGGAAAWRWNGTAFVPVAAPADAVPPAPVTTLEVDLRGDGELLRATLDNGVVRLWDGPEVVWENEAPDWRVSGMTSGDVDNDGRFELLLWLWKPDRSGVPRSHPFLVGWRGGRYRVFWGGSAVGAPIRQAAIGMVNGTRNVLVVLDDTDGPDAPARYVTVWTWQGWSFEQTWRSEEGVYHHLLLRDLDHDGIHEIIAW